MAYDLEKIKELYKTKSIKEVGAEMSLSRHQVRKILVEADIRLRYSQIPQNIIDLMVAEYDVLTVEQLGEKYKYCPELVGKALKANGVKVKRNFFHLKDGLFNSVDTEMEAYFLGFFFADGCISHINEFKIEISERDEILLKIFSDFLFEKCKANPIKRINRPNSKLVSLTFSDEKLCKRFAELGCIPQKTYNSSFNERLSSELSNDMFRHFVRGYLDGDGCIYVSQNNPKLSCVSLYGTVEFLESLNNRIGYIINNSNFKLFKKSKSTNNSGYELNCRKAATKKLFLNWIYNDATVFLERKHAKYIQAIENMPTKYIKRI